MGYTSAVSLRSMEDDMRAVGSDVVKKTYIYANSQIIMQHSGANKYFYLHDRLGSVRQLIDTSADVVNHYTFRPFGKLLEGDRDKYNPFEFTGQWLDDEINEYYLRARQYDPHIRRFTSRDPVSGEFKEPMTLHVYLYCINDPVNLIDPFGLQPYPHGPDIYSGGPDYDWEATQEIIERANTVVGTDFINGPIEAFGLFGRGGRFDYKYTRFTFQLTKYSRVVGSEFSNWLAGYTTFYNYGLAGAFGARRAGHRWARVESEGRRPDEPASRYFISAGILKAMNDRFAEGRSSGSDMGTFLGAKSQLRMFGYNRLLGVPFERYIYKSRFEQGMQIVRAELASDEWWDQLVMLVEFWNAGPTW